MKLLARLLIAGFLLQTASLKKAALRTPADSNLEQQLKASNDTAPLNPKSALPETETQQAKNDSKPLNPKSALPETETQQAKNDSKPLNTKPTAKTSGSQEVDSKKPLDGFLGPPQCLEKKYNRWSCAKVFCPPWMRCLSGECLCKIPYKCPKQEMQRVCGLDGTSYSSMCNAKATSCRSKEPVFSHFNNVCKPEDNVKVTVTASNSHDVVQINTATGKMLVCGNHWDAAAANVVCRDRDQNPRGAKVATKVRYDSLADNINWPSQCVSVQCTGSELSLAECTIYKPKPLMNNTEVAVLKCYKEPTGECESFLCVNGKCLAHEKTCNGVDDCGDNSDEMCCQGCRGQAAFHCSSGVCIPRHAVGDGIRDCLGGEDEQEDLKKTDDLLSDPKSEIRNIRTAAENQLQCGIPNMEYVHRPEDTIPPGRQKRLVGGEEALPTQIQWQVAVQEERSINCGGAYIGGCWVLTAAHCVRAKPKSFRIKFSLWKKHRKLSTTDTIPVKNIIIHHQYNPQTYENDIALIKLEELNLLGKCMHENPAVRSVCVPWSTEQFQPNHTCTISGWGRNKEGKATATLKWANVTLIDNCENYYKKRFLPGMECAGDLEGNVDSCQGDSGGPLVCKDASGVSYVWGIVSWGDKCGEANHPGVYTKVAHYFEWIRFQTGWPAVTKYNQ